MRWPLMIGMILVVPIGLAVSFCTEPTFGSGKPSCLVRRLTGFYCPGCGDTRALHALVHGRILEAFDYNLLFPIALVVFAWLYFVGLTTLFAKRRVMWVPKQVPNAVLILLLVIVVLFTILRNIPSWPFSILAP